MSYDPEVLAAANGGHQTLGWARLKAEFLKNSYQVKLCRDAAFFGKVQNDRILDGFIFDRCNCEPNILHQIADEFFEIRRDHVQSPAYLKVFDPNGLFVNETYIPEDGFKLLKSSDRIKLPSGITLFQFFDDRVFETEGVPLCILEKYHLAAYIGKGGQSTVRLIYRFETAEKFALKILSKQRRLDESEYQFTKRREHMRGEIQAMRRLNHPNIIKLIQVKHGPCDAFIIMELAENGSLLDHMKNNFPGSFLPEDVGKYCLYQICTAVQYIHYKKIAHRDLKLENIFVKNSIGGLVMKVGDFGYAKPANHLYTQLGTACFFPPEIQDIYGEYTIKADIWTLGCLFYASLSGMFPFHSSYGGSVREQIGKGRLRFDLHPQWKMVS